MQLTGHRVLVTGGNRGIGFAIAREFHRRGNRVMVTGRDMDALAAAAAALPGLETVAADLASDADRGRVIPGVVSRLGGLSVLVNNAGVQYRHDYLSDSPEQILTETAREIAVNLTALVALTAEALPHLRAVSEAAVVNISSVLAYTPKRSAPVYCGTKAAVSSFTKALRYQVEDQAPHIQILDVLPPMVDTAMTAGRGQAKDKLSPEHVAARVMRALERGARDLPLGRSWIVKELMRVAPGVAERRLRNA